EKERAGGGGAAPRERGDDAPRRSRADDHVVEILREGFATPNLTMMLCPSCHGLFSLLTGLALFRHVDDGRLGELLEWQIERGEIAKRCDRIDELKLRLLRWLPCSWVNSRAKSSCSASSASASLTSSAARCWSGFADQVGSAVFAAATACPSWVRSARGAVVKTRPLAGLITSSVLAPLTSSPLISNAKSVSPYSLFVAL